MPGRIAVRPREKKMPGSQGRPAGEIGI